MKKQSFYVEWEYEDDNGNQVFVCATGTVEGGNPGSMYNRFGDPGDAPEGYEVSFDKLAAFVYDDDVDDEVETKFDPKQEDSLIDYILDQL